MPSAPAWPSWRGRCGASLERVTMAADRQRGRATTPAPPWRRGSRERHCVDSCAHASPLHRARWHGLRPGNALADQGWQVSECTQTTSADARSASAPSAPAWPSWRGRYAELSGARRPYHDDSVGQVAAPSSPPGARRRVSARRSTRHCASTTTRAPPRRPRVSTTVGAISDPSVPARTTPRAPPR